MKENKKVKSFFGQIKNNFNPLLFLASLGAGGISVAGFILIQYGGLFSGKGLATALDMPSSVVVVVLESIMAGFGVVHLFLTIIFLVGYFSWRKTEKFKSFLENPLVNSALITPLLSLAMSMNVVIAVVRYFMPVLSGNLQAVMAPAFFGYVVLWGATMFVVLSLLKKAFVKTFDVDKIHFGWLLQPFALAMVTVTGSGFAALAQNTETISYNTDIAAAAFFLSLISGTLAVFLTFIKITAIFKKHLHRDGTLENQFMPTYLIVMPILTLFGISIFRFGHYVDHIYNAPILFTLSKLALLTLFAFQVWYFAFGLFMLNGYWGSYLKKTFHISQWGLVCPFVALGALSAFVQKIFVQSESFFYIIFVLLLATSALFLFLLKRQFKCLFSKKENKCDV